MMETTYRTNEFRAFTMVQKEAIEAINSGDKETIHLSMLEIETLRDFTSAPELREAASAFLRVHAEYIPTPQARDAYDLDALRSEIEDGATEGDARSVRLNLGSVETIYQNTKDQAIRADAAALLRIYAART
jgi:hypothetical protein